MKPEVRFHGYGLGNVGNRELYVSIDGRQALHEGPRRRGVSIDGRQALHEGPRRRGRCNLCKGLCRGTNPLCDLRVFDEADKIRRGV